MYKVSVPVMNPYVRRNGREATLREIRRFDAERVFLALDCYQTDPGRRAAALEELADNCRFFREHGLEVGAWIWTFWIRDPAPFGRMRTVTGEQMEQFMCPEDPDFVAFASAYAADIARCGVDLILYDDDFRYGFLADAPACLCERHLAQICRITGKALTREEAQQHILTGGRNAVRDAYLQANGDSLRRFASSVRAAVDRVNPGIRIGACACMSSWDLDGTDAREIAHLLAGKTKPLVRLIGAPYWAVRRNWGNALQDVIELERMESAWTRDGDTEILAEGDVYPRPRINCPASYLEGFDTAIRASGCTDGILKYGIDYYSHADYETAYAHFHECNRELYRAIDRLFCGKEGCGVRVYESMHKISELTVPTKVNATADLQDLFFSKAARALACHAIPTVYQDEGVCGIVFDENARNLPLRACKNGLILDLAAAEILTGRGVDVGIDAIGEQTQAETEHFLSDGNHILTCGTPLYRVRLRPGAAVLSDAETPSGTVPVSFRYENREGCRFLVLNINTRCSEDNLLRHYARGRQFAEQIPWLSGRKLPACAPGHPALYLQCKTDGDSMAVGLWNFFADPALSPTVQFDRAYSTATFLRCDGRLQGDRVVLSDIPPFSCAFFEVRQAR